MEHSEYFKDVINIIETCDENFIFVTGNAGTGKSTLYRALKAHYNNEALCFASTGVASWHVGGQTLHSFFNLPLAPIFICDPAFNKKTYPENKSLAVMQAPIILIDEVSMIRCDIIDAINIALKTMCNSTEPFGGKKIVAFGDLHQLEPVVSNDVPETLFNGVYDSPFFFSADVFSYCKIFRIELSKIFRQSNEEFITLLNNIRLGVNLRESIEVLNTRVISRKELDFSKTTVLTALVKTGSDINLSKLEEIASDARTYSGQISGEYPLNDLPVPFNLLLKVGARVIIVRNGESYVNGTTGVVSRMLDGKVHITTDDNRFLEIKPVEWDKVKGFDKFSKVSQETIVYKQLPLLLGWAMTIHKSQGLTLDSIAVDSGYGMFSHGQLYVALSRCRTLDGLHLLKPLKVSDVKINQHIINFNNNEPNYIL